MQIEVGKKYRINEKHIENDGSCYGINGDRMKELFPGNIVEVLGIFGPTVDIADGYWLPPRILLPLEEVTEGTKRQKDIRLLKESEKKWAGIVYDGKRDGGAVDCPCCNEYNTGDGESGDCPIGGGCMKIGYGDWCNYTYDKVYTVFDSWSEELALNVLSSIGDIRRRLEKEEQDNKEKDSLECYEYVVNGKPTGIRVGEYLRLEIGNVESGDVIPCSTLITLDSPYSGHRGRGCVGTPTGFASDWPDVLMEHFKRNDDGSIKVCVY